MLVLLSFLLPQQAISTTCPYETAMFDPSCACAVNGDPTGPPAKSCESCLARSVCFSAFDEHLCKDIHKYTWCGPTGAPKTTTSEPSTHSNIRTVTTSAPSVVTTHSTCNRRDVDSQPGCACAIDEFSWKPQPCASCFAGRVCYSSYDEHTCKDLHKYTWCGPTGAPGRSTPIPSTTGLPRVVITKEEIKKTVDRLTVDSTEVLPSGEVLGKLFRRIEANVRTLENSVVAQVAPGRAENPGNVKLVELCMKGDNDSGEKGWDYLFPHRNDLYTYSNFLQGVAKFPAFCEVAGNEATSGEEKICRKLLATMFAHFTQETGGHSSYGPEPEWRQGLWFLREVGWKETTPNGYDNDCSSWQGEAWPCGVFKKGGKYTTKENLGQHKSYFGRGAIQLSYNFNYGPFSQFIFGNVEKLLNAPEMVAETWLNLASAMFFYVFPQPPKPSILEVVNGEWVPNKNDLAAGRTSGFGTTIMIVNGGVECGGQKESAQSKNRIAYYREFAKYFEVEIPADEVLGCKGMRRFDGSSSGALPLAWKNKGQEVYECELSSDQTQFNALFEGDYTKCLEYYHPNVVVTG